MPVLSQGPRPASFQSCKAWASNQSADALEMWGIQESGATSNELAVSRLIGACMGEKQPEIVGFGSSVVFNDDYCSRHGDQQICKQSDKKGSDAQTPQETNTSESEFEKLKRLAEGGDAEAMRELGNNYYTGKGIQADQVQALFWIRKAAEANDPIAANNLGSFYEDGAAGLTRDDQAARGWYEKAAGLGNALAMKNLGALYEEGRGGLQQNFSTAFDWYKRGVDAGDTRAMVRLGSMYKKGAGTQQNSAKAFDLFYHAALAGDPLAMDPTGAMLMTGEGTKKDELSGFTWFKKGAEAGDVDAMDDLVRAYLSGVGTAQNDKAAYEWMLKAANAGSSRSMYTLGLISEKGMGGTTPNVLQALDWYRKSADAGLPAAREAVARLNAALTDRESRGNARTSGCRVPRIRQSMRYASARRIIIGAGFQVQPPPVNENGKENCYGDVKLCDAYPEIDNCNMQGYCTMQFTDAYQNQLQVITRGNYDDAERLVTSFSMTCRK